MAKLSKDELLAKISEKITDPDLSIEILEDITDSFNVDESEIKSEMQTKIDDLESKLDDLKSKYKARFLDSTVKVEDESSKEDEDEEKVIDIKEI